MPGLSSLQQDMKFDLELDQTSYFGGELLKAKLKLARTPTAEVYDIQIEKKEKEFDWRRFIPSYSNIPIELTRKDFSSLYVNAKLHDPSKERFVITRSKQEHTPYSHRILLLYIQIVGQLIIHDSDLYSDYSHLHKVPAYLGSFGGGGHFFPEEESCLPVLSVPPTILKCSEDISTEEVLTFEFVLPKNLPPSFVGDSCEFKYKIVVGYHFPAGEATKQEFPLKIYSHINESSKSNVYDANLPIVFKKDYSKVNNSLDAAKYLRMKKTVTVEEYKNAWRTMPSPLPFHTNNSRIRSRKMTSSGKYIFNIAQEGKLIAKLQLPSPNFLIGRNVKCQLHLRESEINTKTVTVNLLSKETWKYKYVCRKVFSLTLNLENYLETSFPLNVDRDCAESFVSSIVKLEWFLDFHFDSNIHCQIPIKLYG